MTQQLTARSSGTRVLLCHYLVTVLSVVESDSVSKSLVIHLDLMWHVAVGGDNQEQGLIHCLGGSYIHLITYTHVLTME